ncbi:hypothetical protein JCM8208_000929 [Rhodotorula glutinis]
MANTPTHPRASLLGIPTELLARVVQLGAPSLHEQEFEPAQWHIYLDAVSTTCRALYKAAKPLRHRLVTLDNADLAHLAADTDAAQVARRRLEDVHFLHAYADNLAALRKVYPLLKAVESLRLWLGDDQTYDLTDLADLPHLRRLTLTDGTISASDRLPTGLVELELLGIKADKDVVDRLLQSNPHLETVHLTPLEAGPGDLYCPGAALAALGRLRFFQFTPPRLQRGEDAPRPAYDTLLAPFVRQLAPSLLFVHDTVLASPSALKRDLRRLLVQVDEYDADHREAAPAKLVKVAKWVRTAPHLELVALPVDLHPDYTSNRFSDQLGLQLGINSIVNACEARRVRVVYFDRDREMGPGVVALSDEVRNGRCRGADIDDSRDKGDKYPEWPGSWAALSRKTRFGQLVTESEGEEREQRRDREQRRWHGGGGGYGSDDSDESGSDWSI